MKKQRIRDPQGVRGEHSSRTSPARATVTDDDDSMRDAVKTVGGQPDKARGSRWKRFVVYGAIPALVLVLAMVSGYLKWQGDSLRQSQDARATAVPAAIESTVALLSYRPDSVDKDLNMARDRLTGSFRDEYTKLINDVVIPGAKQQQISAVATVPAAAVVSATDKSAVLLLFVNQTVNIGTGAPTNTASSVRVTLEKTDTRWLITKFDPV